MDDLITALRRAFPAAPITERELDEPASSWANYDRAEEMRPRVLGRTWQELDAKLVEDFHEALIFAGPAAFARLVPAYLEHLLKLEGFSHALYVVAGQLTRKSDPLDASIFDARLAALTAEQRAIVRDIVLHLAARPAMERALASARTTFQEVS